MKRLAVALLALAANQGAPQPVGGRWHFEAGQELAYDFTQRAATRVKVGDQEFDNTTTLSARLAWHVRAVKDDGSADIVQTVERVRVTVESGPQRSVYDSHDDE